jgi:hypothetical protein
VRSFANLSIFDPDSVAQAFLETLSSPKSKEKMTNYDDNYSKNHNQGDTELTPRDPSSASPASVFEKWAEKTPVTRHGKSSHNDSSSEKSPHHSDVDLFDDPLIENLEHIFQFCYVCSKEKIRSVIYSISKSPDILDWQSSIERLHLSTAHASLEFPKISTQAKLPEDLDDDDVTIDSSLSLKDRHMTHTFLKISDNLDQNTLRLTKENEDKAKGFAKLESHKKTLILNASEHTDSETSPKEPSEFCRSFLQKLQSLEPKMPYNRQLRQTKTSSSSHQPPLLQSYTLSTLFGNLQMPHQE